MDTDFVVNKIMNGLGTFNFIHFCTEIVSLAVHYYYQLRNSLDGVVELIQMREIYLSRTIHNLAHTFDIALEFRE